MKKLLTILMLLAFIAPLTHAADDLELLDNGDQAVTTDAWTGTDDTLGDTGTGDTTGDELTLDDGTGEDDLTLDDGTGEDTLDGDTLGEDNTDANAEDVEMETPTFEKVADTENAYKFNFPIEDATKTYAVEFATGTEDLTLVNLVLGDGNVSDDLKASFSVIVSNDEGTTTYSLEDIENNTNGVEVKAGDKVYLIYNPEDRNNSTELLVLNNAPKFYAEELTQPKELGEITFDEVEGLQFTGDTIEYVEANEDNTALANYNPEVKEKEVKETLTKKDTWPMENTIFLLLGLLSLGLLGYKSAKKES